MGTSEGTIVIYSIMAKPGTSGTYALDLGWIGPNLLNCGVEFILVSGNGLPNYTFESECITISSTSTYSSTSGTAGNATTTTETTRYPTDLVVVVPIGAINSTN